MISCNPQLASTILGLWVLKRMPGVGWGRVRISTKRICKMFTKGIVHYSAGGSINLIDELILEFLY